MNRVITSHKVKGLNDCIEIYVEDEPGQGGACHKYRIDCISPFVEESHGRSIESTQRVQFQDGPIKEFGVNGLTNESLLAIVLDRLEGFQSGEFACRENALAKTKIQEAMHWLHHRTNERLQRRVEGMNQK